MVKYYNVSYCLEYGLKGSYILTFNTPYIPERVFSEFKKEFKGKINKMDPFPFYRKWFQEQGFLIYIEEKPEIINIEL